ncbi:hypothetical protein LBMAG25_17050 [Bacteroidota bacterium]|nr:hypothetical protein LBMAG25_17050 [Bacteroidota bacterium]
MEMAKKTPLRITYTYDFHLWGIVTTLKDFQVSWEINKSFKINLSRKQDIEIQSVAKGRQLFFGLFSSHDRFKQGTFYLIANKYYNEYLIPEMKEFDFFLRYDCDASDEELKLLFAGLKAIQPFALVVRVNPNKLKSKHQLIIE